MSDNKFYIDACLLVDFHEKKSAEESEIKLLELKYKYMLMIQEQENDRRRTVEHKASLFLTSNAIIGSLLVWSSRIIFEEWSIQTFILSFFLLLLIVLLARTIFYTLKVLKKCTYQVLDQNDVQDYTTEQIFYQEMETKTRQVIEYNQKVINNKVDNMALAQKNYKWFWIVMVLYLLMIFGVQVYSAVGLVSFINNISVANISLFIMTFFVGLCLGDLNH